MSAAAVVAAILGVLVLTRDATPGGVGATASPGDGAGLASATPVPTFPPAGAATPTLTSSPTEAPTETASPTATAAATVSPTPVPTPSPTRDGPPIITVAEEQDPFDGIVESVIADEDAGGFVAVGSRDGEMMAWSSSDGASWEAQSVPHTPREGESSAGMGSLARFEGTLYSLGTGAGRADDRWPLAWRTENAVIWEEIESQSEFYQAAYLIWDLVAGDPGLLAVNHGFGASTGGTWLWTLGTSWVQTTPGGVDYMDSGITIHDATWGEDRYVAVGNREEETQGASWTSDDGRSWDAAPGTVELDDAALRAVSLAPGGGFVAVGSIGEEAAAWTSDDGLTWSRAELPADDAIAAHAVVPAAGGLMALGVTPEGTRIWTSRDGASWTDAATVEGEVRTWDFQRSGNDPVAFHDGIAVVFVSRGDETILWRFQIE